MAKAAVSKREGYLKEFLAEIPLLLMDKTKRIWALSIKTTEVYKPGLYTKEGEKLIVYGLLAIANP